jgi:hypothetical protein
METESIYGNRFFHSNKTRTLRVLMTKLRNGECPCWIHLRPNERLDGIFSQNIFPETNCPWLIKYFRHNAGYKKGESTNERSITTMTTASKNMLLRHLNNLLCDTKTKVFSRFVVALVTCHAETAASSVSRIIAPRLSKAAILISCCSAIPAASAAETSESASTCVSHTATTAGPQLLCANPCTP